MDWISSLMDGQVKVLAGLYPVTSSKEEKFLFPIQVKVSQAFKDLLPLADEDQITKYYHLSIDFRTDKDNLLLPIYRSKHFYTRLTVDTAIIVDIMKPHLIKNEIAFNQNCFSVNYQSCDDKVTPACRDKVSAELRKIAYNFTQDPRLEEHLFKMRFRSNRSLYCKF